MVTTSVVYLLFYNFDFYRGKDRIFLIVSSFIRSTPFSLHDDAYILKLMHCYQQPEGRNLSQSSSIHSSSSSCKASGGVSKPFYWNSETDTVKQGMSISNTGSIPSANIARRSSPFYCKEMTEGPRFVAGVNSIGVLCLVDDLLDSSRKLESPMRVPKGMLLSWKKEPVD
ncbi:hypothetical protein Goklo_021867 [Gossypium klotzschianum]|uniref:Uncharacterized protein n=1 Tax=Gossypium klotzschianum TaxID=34286 RepID=A0A7J8UWV0_9ROSI|nr:hypothetical protein [Gossypium klotzschianum]